MKILAIVGQTSVGKTDLSIEVAKAINGEVISADSRQVYTGLNVGAGKIKRNEMQGVPHHLLDVADPKKTFTASDFVRLGRAAISEIAAGGHVPVIVGGAGFYIDALLERIVLAQVPPDKKLRKDLKKKSLEKLQKMLQKLDPKRYRTIETKNPVRLIRAIEIALWKPETGSRKREASSLQSPVSSYSSLWIGLTLSKEELAQKIYTRLHARIRSIVAEVQRLHTKGLSWKRMEELGLEYRYTARYLQGKLTREKMLTQLESEIKKYAKRQMTWFKRNKEIQWFRPEEREKVMSLARKFLSTNAS